VKSQPRINLRANHSQPQLLVSVRTAEEARIALKAGADVIDVKEPARGALGAADRDTIEAIVREVNGSAPVTAALGELVDLVNESAIAPTQNRELPAGVALFKIGLARCHELKDWRSLWRTTVTSICAGPDSPHIQPVAVVYADWRRAQAPSPDSILEAAVDLGCPALLVDTYDKTAGNLFDHWKAADLSAFVRRVHESRIIAVLAGSLSNVAFEHAVKLYPDIVAVRGAACDGDRRGSVSAQRVKDLKSSIARLANYSHRTSTSAR
jgi:(5-formylfuran-3-yl)methyl phosphate synthase